jgi:hypothetical protein
MSAKQDTPGGNAMTDALRLTEPVPIDDDLCTALAYVEDLGFGGRLVFYATQTLVETGGMLHVVKRKIVLPRAGMVKGNEMVRAFLAGKPAPLRAL